MTVLAVSDFMRTLFIILVATPFILLWGAALLDLIRGHHSGWAIVAWMIMLPEPGSISLTIAVLDAVPLLFHSSMPWEGS